jgi:enediyne biosynthesis protein E4
LSNKASCWVGDNGRWLIFEKNTSLQGPILADTIIHFVMQLKIFITAALLVQHICLFAQVGADQLFTKITNSVVTTTNGDSRSVNWIDTDNDGDLDLFITNGPENGENNFLYTNDGLGNFTAIANDPIVIDGLPSVGATWADYNNDGLIDCFVTNWYNVNNLLYKNLGNNAFERITTGPPVTNGGYSETATWGDYDRDGWADLYVTNSDGNFRNFLYKNNQNGTFTRITTGTQSNDQLASRSANWTDINSDGFPDLFVTNENNQAENMYQNNGDGTFTKITTGPLLNSGGKTMSSSWGDFDNDGDLDVFVANDQGNDGLYRNMGNFEFEAMAQSPVSTAGGNSFGSQWADVDNDGDLDLFVTNAFWGGLWKNFLFLNDGTGQFERNLLDVTTTDLGWAYGCAFGDMDNDGDLDLAVATCYDASQTDYLYRNNASDGANKWVQFHLEGTASNRSAIGAIVRVQATIDGQVVRQMREVSAQSGYAGQNQLDPHFGLKDAATLDSVIVTWPSGQVEKFAGMECCKKYTLIEGQGIVHTTVQSPALKLGVLPNPATHQMLLRWEQKTTESGVLQVFDARGALVARTEVPGQAGFNEWPWQVPTHITAGWYEVILRQGAQSWRAGVQVVR